MKFKTAVFLLITNVFMAQIPQVSTGKIIEQLNFPSKFVGKKNVRIWLPDNYNPKTKYQVLYANDGQMLWDSIITWNHQEWKLDETLGTLIADKKVKPTLVVAIDNAGEKRSAEYFPQKPFESLPAKTQDSLYLQIKSENQKIYAEKVFSDQYLKFLVQELKPFIDKNYSTYTDAQHTFIMGSSMGGLISMYAVCEYPNVFGGAICMSTHWIGTYSNQNNPIPKAFYQYLNNKLPNPKNHKFYFDYGTETLDAYYQPYQLKVDAILKSKKYTSKSWKTIKFDGENHSEASWSKRLSIPLTWMLN